MKFHRTGLGPLAAACAAMSVGAWADESLQEIVVTASLRDSNAADLPQSVSVLDAATLQAAGVQHFEDVLTMIPNLSWASGSSRPRFFLMRGIGEVEQYQGAPNPSVGFLIDDIDFSGVGMPATLFDTRQIEVLRRAHRGSDAAVLSARRGYSRRLPDPRRRRGTQRQRGRR